jgi:uncharacterized membrane protein
METTHHRESDSERSRVAAPSFGIAIALPRTPCIRPIEEHPMPTSVTNVAAKSALPAPQTVRQAAAYLPEIRRNVGPTERIVSLGLGSVLTVAGITGRRIHPVCLATGGYLLYRALSANCPLCQAVGAMTRDEEGSASVMPARAGAKVEHAITVNRPVAEVYRFWRNLSQLPRFMTHLKEVREFGGKKSHWVARGPLGMSVEWDAEIIVDRPNEVISWKSLDGSDVDTAGSVHFRPAPGNRGTEVRVSLKYDPPAGKVGAFIAKLFGTDPKREIEDDLARFKSLLEAGEAATTAGQPSRRK